MMKKMITMGILMLIMLNSLTLSAFADEQTRSELQEIEVQLEAIAKEQGSFDTCREVLIPLYDAETLKFLDFLEQHFQNKSGNSSLTNIAVARYRDYTKSLDKDLASLAPEATSGEGSNATIGEEILRVQQCRDLTQLYKSLAKQRLIDHIRNTNYQKKTTAFVEKYKSINDGLRSLNLSMAEMYGFFLTFKNKLPGFLSQCVRN